MVAANFSPGLQFVLKEEGGNDDDPHDHGGRTSRGITQREWDAWRKSHPNNNWPSDVWSAPQDQVNALYKAQYWDPYCDKMPNGLDVSFFDFNVNAGRTQAVKTLQKSVDVSIDGMMGVITWDAVNSADPRELISAFAKNRELFYRALAQFSRYGDGWTNRTNACEQFSLSLIPTSQPPAAPASTPTKPKKKRTPKANPKDIKRPPINPEGGTIASGGLLALLGSLKDQLSALTGVPNIQYYVLGITVLIFTISLYGFWHRSQMQQQVG